MFEAKNLVLNPKIWPVSYAKEKGVLELVNLFRFNFFNQVSSFEGECFPKSYSTFTLKLMSNKAWVSNIAGLIFEQEPILL